MLNPDDRCAVCGKTDAESERDQAGPVPATAGALLDGTTEVRT